ncbi:hypothetical protein MYCTH_2311484, partial [Thermothelomyces thermophilus ATCC 42464]
MTCESTSSLSSRAIASWEANAAYWDSTITKQGNKYWRRLQEPSLTRLLKLTLSSSSPCRALDLATGNGLCARWLVRNGATSVLATDASENMLALARAHCEDGEESELERKEIRWRRVDVTSKSDLTALARDESPFEIVLMNMAIMDVADLEPLAGVLRDLLVENGVFVATLLHPVFFTSNATRNIEVRFDPVTGESEIVRGKIVREYMSVPPSLGIAVPGQPEKQV